MSCRKQTRRIDGLFLGARSGSELAELAGHLRGCAQCARYYNRAVLVSRQLAGAPDQVCPEELALAGAALVVGARPARPVAVRWRWGALAAVLALVVLMIAVGLVRTGAGDEGRVQARGQGALAGVSLRAFCVSAADPANLQVVASSDEAGRLSCRRDQLLQFVYRLDDQRPAWLYLAGVDAQGELLRYYPRPSEKESLRLPPSSSEQPLPGSIRLSVRHSPGPVEVIGLITSRPLSEEEGDARVKRAARADKPAGGELRLTLEVLAGPP